jgi:hypothetical protein
MKAGILRVSLKHLEEAWAIPEEHHIEWIQYDIEDSYSGTVKLLIVGPNLPEVFEGDSIPLVEGMLVDGQLIFKW